MNNKEIEEENLVLKNLYSCLKQEREQLIKSFLYLKWKIDGRIENKKCSVETKKILELIKEEIDSEIEKNIMVLPQNIKEFRFDLELLKKGFGSLF